MPKLTLTEGCAACSILRALRQAGWQVGRTFTVLGLTYRTYHRNSERCSLLILGRSFSMWTSLKPKRELSRIWHDARLLYHFSSLAEIYTRRTHSDSSDSTTKSTESPSKESYTALITVKDQIELSVWPRQTE